MSGRINLDNISDDFKSYLQGLGLAEEQVNEAISLFVGDKSELQTENKQNIVNAINENKTSILELQTELGTNKNKLIQLSKECITI